MQHLKNIVAGEPQTEEQRELTKKLGIVWLYDEKGKNWYEEQKNFQADTLKVAYDQNGIIRIIDRDVSAINPAGLSVVELKDTEENTRADISGAWMFKDGKIIERIYTPEELKQQAERKKAALQEEAESTITLLERTVRLNMAEGNEQEQLEAWERYSVTLSRVDTSNPEWPDKPGT
ncbi:tail fiber assembly protein [Escherichia coli]|uniref:tail fiber assembly protein n=1 Tax=Escherichia coli TaxID=562 RepID=UPI00287A9975|nr:tail fiber assembly protein [Escherichia coli]MDS1619848.1 tail fiber assembly protein [Escherichia coli]